MFTGFTPVHKGILHKGISKSKTTQSISTLIPLYSNKWYWTVCWEHMHTHTQTTRKKQQQKEKERKDSEYIKKIMLIKIIAQSVLT